MPDEEPLATKDRVLAEAMRLFGSRGYAATTIAQIEAAAGLSPGSGALYRHFRSKAHLLTEGITRLVNSGEDMRTLLAAESEGSPLDDLAGRERLEFIARAGLLRLEEERDLNRILMRDLQEFPELLEIVKDAEIAGNHKALTGRLSGRPTAAGRQPDWAAVGAVAMDALAHYWLLCDVFGGEHPTGVSRERYLGALVDLVHAFSRSSEKSAER